MPTAMDTRKNEIIQAMYQEIGLKGIPSPEYDTPEKIAARIREIAPAIRSAKWRNAVEAYAQFVETEGTGPHLQWAYMQGSVYFANMLF